MTDISLHDVHASAQKAMQAFEALKTDILPLKAKLDAFDQAAVGRMEKSIGDAIELSHAATAQADARAKAIEAELDQIKAAMNRPGAAAADDKAAMSAKASKLFNEFARFNGDSNKISFDSYLKAHGKDDLALKAMSVNSDPNGGYLVIPEFGGVIQTYVYESSPIRQLASAITIGTDTYEVLLDNDQSASGWVGETQARTDTTTPTLGKLVITVNEQYAQPKATQKMIDDSAIDIEGWLSGKVADKFARDEATAFVSGTGYNQPKGLLSYPNGTTVASQQVQQVNSGSSGAFTYAGLVNLQNALKEPYQTNAVFLIQRASNVGLLTIVDGQSRPIFNLDYSKNAGLEPTILGKPVRFAADMPAIGSNALAAVYGDIKAAYQIVDRAGIRVLRDPFTNTPFVKFYTTRRVGGSVTNFEAYKIQKLA